MDPFAMDMQPDGWWILAAGLALIVLVVAAVAFLLGRVYEQHRADPDPQAQIQQMRSYQQSRREEPTRHLPRYHECQGRRDSYVNEEDYR